MPTRFNPQKHHRHSIRLKEFDYSQAGAYYVTIVAWQRQCLFGEIMKGEMKLNPYGKIVQKWWNEIPKRFHIVGTSAFIVMPNHVHGIIIIHDNRRGTVPVPKNEANFNNIQSSHENDETGKSGGETPPLRVPTLGQIVAYFKYQSSKEMNALDSTGTITKFWQRNYYEHIIRDEQDMQNKTDYIESNPMMWDEDDENPFRTR